MTIFGWDISHYDWERGLTAAEIRAAVSQGIAFATHKIGEGTSYADPRFGDFWQAARGLDGVLLGAYYVNHPGSQETQADRFLSLLDNKAPGWRDRPFILQLDAERFDYMDREPSLAEIQAFIARLRAKAPAHRPIVYAPKWLYGNRLSGLGAPLWASNYGNNPAQPYQTAYPGDGSSRWAGYSGQTPVILQYGSRTQIATQSTCDANAYRGTREALRDLVYPQGGNMSTAKEVLAYDPNDAKDPAAVINPSWRPDAKTNPTIRPAWAIGYTLDLLGQLHASMKPLPAQMTSVLNAVSRNSTDTIIAEIRAQGEQTRQALLAEVQQIAPGLASAVAERIGGEVTASEIGEALARELAAMLGTASARVGQAATG